MSDPTSPVEITETEAHLIIMLRDFSKLFNTREGEPDMEARLYWNCNEQRWEIKVPGFYKHGEVTVYFFPGKDVAIRGFTYHEYQVMGRYGPIDEIRDFDGLISTNFVEWQNYQDRAPGWNVPDSRWLPHLLRTGRIKKHETTVVSYLPA